MILSAKAFVRLRKSSFSSFIPHPSTLPSRDRRTIAGFALQQRQYFLHQRVRRDAVLLPQDRNGSVLNELVGPTDPDDWRIDHLRMEMLHDGAAETVMQDVVFNRTDDFNPASEKLERAGVDRFDPPRVDERDRESFLFEF